jgi:formate C-acetyltransferase
MHLPGERILSLKRKTLSAERFLSLDQAKIITRVYRENEHLPVILKRAMALSCSLDEMPVSIDPEELIVGNRTPEIRAGVVFPEAGISWIKDELESLHKRPQDPFNVRSEDARYFLENIEPYWKGKTLEDNLRNLYGKEIKAIEKVVKINQKDHAQGHICPKAEDWLMYGPAGLAEHASNKLVKGENADFYKSVLITLEAACRFMQRYAILADDMSRKSAVKEITENLRVIAECCDALSRRPPETFREALQSVWFLFVILHMESNASSFSPGRMDQYLYPFYEKDISEGRLYREEALELLDALFIKFNQIVYMRNSNSARYFAGFPTGFNVTIGGQTRDGKLDAANDLSFLFLLAQEHVRLPQPNLTARLHEGSSWEFIDECSRIIGLGTGMPQIVNDESIIPALRLAGVDEEDVFDYALVGCVELSTSGSYLGWSDAAMFNLVKVLELTLNDGRCMISGQQAGLKTGILPDYREFSDIENAYEEQIDFFINRMVRACEVVEKCHREHLPSPFLSSVVDNCLEKGMDVTAGGAKYNFSGIQAIQVANVADCLAVLKKILFDDRSVNPAELHSALLSDFKDNEALRQICINHVPKYGNDIEWVDKMGAKWITEFAVKLRSYRNFRGGPFTMGLYTVSAHVPMGSNVAATPDGRHSGDPLADGGLSPMYGRDKNGPTAVINSVSRIPSFMAPNGTLLNMKFLPSMFSNINDRQKFLSFLSGFIRLPVHHVQFNVISSEELVRAKADPQSYRGLTIRVAGYTAFFTELSSDLQDEIIKRTTHGMES